LPAEPPSTVSAALNVAQNLPAPPQRRPMLYVSLPVLPWIVTGCIGCGGEDVDRVGARAGVERHPLHVGVANCRPADVWLTEPPVNRVGGGGGG